MARNNSEAKMETTAVKTNEANLEELNRKIVEIKRKIVLSGESFISSLTFSPPSVINFFLHVEGQKKANFEEWVGFLIKLLIIVHKMNLKLPYRKLKRSKSLIRLMILKRTSRHSRQNWNIFAIRRKKTKNWFSRTRQFNKPRKFHSLRGQATQTRVLSYWIFK